MSTRELLVRPAVVKDVPAMMAIYNHYVETSHATFEIDPVSLENRLAWFGGYGESGPFRLVVAEQDGQVIGYAGSGRFREKPAYVTSVEMTVYVDPDARGQGVAAELERFAHVARGRLLEEDQVLDEDRLIEIVLAPDVVDVLLPGVERDQGGDRVTGEEDQDEAQDADGQQHEGSLPESLKEVAGHERVL